MKKTARNINRKSYSTRLLLLLTGLLIISSCDIRKSVQAGLDIPVTRQLNPVKAVTSAPSVCHLADTETNLIYKNPNHDIDAGNFFQYSGDSIKPARHNLHHSYNSTSGWPLTSKVESYILFRQMKSYLYL